MRDLDGNWEKFDDYVLDFALDRLAGREEIVLVTLVNIEGTSPRPLGAQMAVSASGEWVGTLSGGCLERAVVAEALAALEAGESRCLRYGHGSKFMDIRLPCGSAIDLHFAVGIAAGELAAVDARLAARRPASLRIGAGVPGRAWIRHYWPRRRLLVAGSSTAAVQLARLAQCAGFVTLLLSPDEAAREAARAHGIETHPLASGAGRSRFEADPWTAIAFMFHDHDWERDLIPAALETPAFYIGAMGSRRAHRLRLEMLAAEGVDAARASRIRGPAGLFSGTRSATDLSISVLAEIIRMDTERRAPLLEITATARSPSC